MWSGALSDANRNPSIDRDDGSEAGVEFEVASLAVVAVKANITWRLPSRQPILGRGSIGLYNFI